MLLIFFRGFHYGKKASTIDMVLVMGLDLTLMFMKVRERLQFTILSPTVFYLHSENSFHLEINLCFFHGGPHLISFRPHARNVPLQASMTVTDG